ncbi:MAG TPA: polyprenyl synthetase family protein [Chitinophagales bacterium]|nr:polyprenyl synthetase family protein [Chitinophagales bacterium]
MQSIEKLQQLFEEELRKQRFNRQPRNLYEPFEYILGLSGKRMRPVMLMMACEMFGIEASNAIPQAIAIELFHNFTLIHDDIMDRAPLRRGMPAVHEKFNQTIAILSGDAMLVYAYHFLIQTKFSPVEKLVSIFNDCAIKVCEGQQTDMNFETAGDVSVEDYLFMIELKTATLLAASLQIGALVGGAPDADANHIYEFGRELGIAFQLKDDWLDAFGDADKTGKQTGGDIIQHKKTFLFLEAIKLADGSSRNELLNLFSSNEKQGEKQVKTVLEIFRRLNIDHITKEQSDRHYANAISYLEKVSLTEQEKKPLRNLAAALMQREH